MAEEQGSFDFGDVVEAITKKRPRRTIASRSFLNCCTLVEERKVARRCDAQTTRSRCLSGLIEEAERSSAPFASKIGGGSGIGRDSGGDAGELQHVLTQSRSENNDLSCYW